MSSEFPGSHRRRTNCCWRVPARQLRRLAQAGRSELKGAPFDKKMFTATYEGIT
jgi:hypothetical protein